MGKVSIELITLSHAEEIFEFEKDNRTFFESIIPGRPDHYYIIENLRNILTEIEQEIKDGLCYMYIIRNELGKLVGRVNLFSIMRGMFQKCEIGFRIGKEYNGKGYATEAVRLVIDEAFNKYNLHRIEAGTSPKNIGSQIVLIKNGFEFVGRARQVIQVKGKWEDSLLFEIINNR